MMTQDTGIAGEMIGELVNKNPLVAITLNPKVSIITKEDLKNYRIGSYRNFTTSHTFASYFVGIPTQPYEKTEIATALTNREIDIAIILLEDALEIERLGGEIVYSFIEEFNRFCFTGLTTTNITSNEGKITNKGFINAIQESLRYIRKNKEKALSDFSMMFSSIKNPEILFEWYVSCWKEHLVPDEYDTRKSYEIWK
ncbi:hypothetical protein FACS1894176_05060 [Bacteroidia bacterium]|nr:hypothetical protein FACS1894176_05060 [Bacteroidia bacterium]